MPGPAAVRDVAAAGTEGNIFAATEFKNKWDTLLNSSVSSKLNVSRKLHEGFGLCPSYLVT